jgi:3-hydroxyisobutyrate dehydrogenase-like beta-hydroxyacid dehydrogenase
MAADSVSIVGLIGVGRMGEAMAERLIGAKHRILAYDSRSDLAVIAERLGALRAESIAEVAQTCTTVLTCLPSADICEDVALQLAEGAMIRTHVETSTIGRSGIARVVAAHPQIATVDSPISGGPRGARAGTLSAIVSGQADAISAVRPLLDDLAAHVFIAGPRAGDAQMAKIVNNALSICAMVASCEAIVLGVKAGLDARELVDFINVSTGRNSATLDKFPKAILPRSFDCGGALGIGTKDLQLYLDEAAAEGLPTWSVASAAEVWRLAVAELGEDVDLTALVRFMERRAGVEVDGRSKA